MTETENSQENRAVSETPVIRMHHKSDHKAVVRYSASEADALISDVYVKRTLATPMPKSIVVTVAPA